MNDKQEKAVELLGVLLDLESGLSPWEVDFVEKMNLKVGYGGTLNDWEMKKITEIYDERSC